MSEKGTVNSVHFESEGDEEFKISDDDIEQIIEVCDENEVVGVMKSSVYCAEKGSQTSNESDENIPLEAHGSSILFSALNSQEPTALQSCEVPRVDLQETTHSVLDATTSPQVSLPSIPSCSKPPPICEQGPLTSNIIQGGPSLPLRITSCTFLRFVFSRKENYNYFSACLK
jgi:hypothetical protein